ncbi:hypothetical protein C2E20_6995 [Micractinium conductrix]|uniref:DUF7811 domain-containing protein n=1 Tax=Micractinium conductrix TaxID=554055 RepID=A0A2P6V641_9CHLO|nr:hypothetical protein C2E20_6995 [Micractinium conductrix]|eukprot:PSC69556.1 hypothetical protein C2E20_6995 [Micractinium conductrix]
MKLAAAAPSGPLVAPVRPVHSQPRRGAAAHARYGRRWWSDAWMEGDGEPGGTGGAFDGGSAPRADQQTTIFCKDGSVVRLGAFPHPLLDERRSERSGGGGEMGAPLAGAPLPLPEEQGLCIGSVFTISATNGIDAARRLNLLGFCFSTEQLFERVEDTVLRRGGEVVMTQRKLNSGVHECLHMRVAIPLLFGVPPEYERLRAGVIQGGGVIERVTRDWIIY